MMEEVLHCWFEELEPAQWWAVDAALDEQLRQRFLPLLEAAQQGELFAWRSAARGRLAEIIVLDQFSRNIHRGTPQAFSQDGIALVLAQEAVAGGVLEQLSTADERAFLLMPYMHSESALIHVDGEKLFRRWTAAGSLDYELRHKAIIDRFGRYPHRNQILGRSSTAEEVEFLRQPGSSF